MAIETKLGWILSGPVEAQVGASYLTVCATHTLKIEACAIEHNLDNQLKQFWELEALGICSDEPSVYDQFMQRITFNGERYEVSLPWKPNHPPLPDHYDLCCKRLFSLLRRLKQNPSLLAGYDSVMKEQLERGMIEEVKENPESLHDHVHYLPHHGVVRQDKSTTKLRVVYDASARTSGPSLNDCLYAGPSFGPSIFDILLRFRLHPVIVAGVIEKAFLMVSVKEEDRDTLRFLWVRDIKEDNPEVMILRFTRVAFGVSSSPFLLNATIKHHMETYREVDPGFIKKLLHSIYVDDVTLGAEDVVSGYELYLKAKTRLAEAGFKLRKFITNYEELRERIDWNERSEGFAETKISCEEELLYAKSSLGNARGSSEDTHKILGIRWNHRRDELVFDIGEISQAMLELDPTKRNVVSMSARFFDPLGVVSPVTVLFKLFFQKSCETKIGWDEPLTDELKTEWDQLLHALQGASTTLTVPRCYLGGA